MRLTRDAGFWLRFLVRRAVVVAIARGFVVLDCESGSGASLDAQGNSVVFWYHFGGVGAWLGAVRAVALC